MFSLCFFYNFSKCKAAWLKDIQYKFDNFLCFMYSILYSILCLLHPSKLSSTISQLLVKHFNHTPVNLDAVCTTICSMTKKLRYPTTCINVH